MSDAANKKCDVCGTANNDGLRKFVTMSVNVVGGATEGLAFCPECAGDLTLFESQSLFHELRLKALGEEPHAPTAELARVQTRLKLKSLAAQRRALDAQVEALCDACPHDWEELSRGDDHDGYSRVAITYYVTYRCRVCDKRKTDTTTSEGR